jgi:hypothetical protein
MAKIFVFIVLVGSAVVLIFLYQANISDSTHGHRSTHERYFRASEPIRFGPYHSLLDMNKTGNLPDVYLDDKAKKPSRFNQSCARFPGIFDLKFKNDHWQVQNTSKGNLYLFNAYLDKRQGTSVRILATYNQPPRQFQFYCQFWYPDSSRPVIVQSRTALWLFRMGWGAEMGSYLHPYLISCEVKSLRGKLPISVSLVEGKCDSATNNLKIFGSKRAEKKNFVVCVKGLSFPYQDMTTRLAEWIEYLNILGAEKINFYEFKVHPNTKKLLEYYEEKGLIEVTPLTLAGDYSNHPYLQTQFLRKKIVQRRLQEVIPYNDCLYKHLHEFKYVVLLDTDEVIVPVEGTWVDLIATLNNTLGKKSSYMARNVYFLDNHLHQHPWFEGIPQYMHMLQHVNRAENYTKPKYFVKGFHDTDKVLALHNHYPFGCLGVCTTGDIDVSLAHLQHYRSDCASGVGVSGCEAMRVNSVIDTRVWNFKDELINRVESALTDLHMLH